MAIPFPSKVSISPDVISHELDRAMLLLNVKLATYTHLDAPASAIWKVLMAVEDAQTVLDLIFEHVGGERGDVERALAGALEKFAAAGLVHLEMSGPTP